MKKEYNIGLDIGNTSVGWSVVEKESNKVIRKGNKKLWGVRLFDPADTAVERRVARSTRRRYDRRRKRIKLLQEEFKTEVNRVDNQFFTKLKESFFLEDDEKNRTVKLTEEDKKLQKEYKTIYHLRKDLITSSEKKDIRLVYLAIHHIIKYRGNFLYEKENFNVENLDIKKKIIEVMDSIYNLSSEIELNDDYLNTLNLEELETALLSKSKNDKKVLTKNILGEYLPKETLNEICKMIVGNKFQVGKLLRLELEEDIQVSFSGTDYDEKYMSLESLLGERIEIIDLWKQLYDMLFLKEMFQGYNHTSLSSLMVDHYLEHESDLSLLRQLFLIDIKIYNQVFRTKKRNSEIKNACLYEKYIHNFITQNDFITQLKKHFESIVEKLEKQELIDKYTLEIIPKMNDKTLLPRITDSENGKYPYQLNKEELKAIIKNQGKYYPFLLKTTEDGKYKLEKLLEFKIPYYVGPLNNTTKDKKIKNSNAWLVRSENNVTITPYNFDQVVDLETTAEKFITRMISNCTYLLKEPVMAANSILYSKYKVMNELKQIKVNDIKLTNEFQKKIYNELFLKTDKTITETVFSDYLRQCEEMSYNKEIKITGYSSDKKFASNMKSYFDFFGKNGIFEHTSYSQKEADDIIRFVTIFEDKSILETKIRNEYKELDDIAIKKILSKKYKGWSSLSEKLLTQKYYLDKRSNVKKSILDLLEETDLNFMQIINEKEYNFQKMIAEENQLSNNQKINYDLVADLATSPATKRGIYQALKVVEEIVRYMEYEPNKIIIEMARGEEKKIRKDSRKDDLIKLYTKHKEEINDYHNLYTQLDQSEKIDSQKLFLYFIQEGKSLYSGKPLNIEALNTYEIDHIIPRTLIKDDSIDNKALVLREENQEKAANFVLPLHYRSEERKKWWAHLKKIGLLSPKKFYNLCRKEYSQEDIEGFINRQLVETRQITKHVANILSSFHKKTKIVYLTAKLSHNYREKHELYKFRDLNDFHHAHDAYLAATLGEYKETHLKHTDFAELKHLNQKLKDQKEYKKLNYGYVINSMDNNSFNEDGEVLFDADSFHKTIENTLYQNDILISRKTEIKTGQFYKETKSKKGQAGVPLKGNLPTEKYGSYTSLNISHMVFVEYKKKQKLIGIPILNDLQQTTNEYIIKQLGLKEKETYSILLDRIPMNTLIEYQNQLVYIRGYSVAKKYCEVANAVQLKIEKNKMKKWKKTLNQVLNQKNPEIENEEILNEILIHLLEKMTKRYPLYENIAKKLDNVVLNNKLLLEEKIKLIKEILKMLGANSVNANLSFLKEKGLGERVGRLSGVSITTGKIYYKSITGLKERTREFQNCSNYESSKVKL